jgi:hypothetical protein
MFFFFFQIHFIHVDVDLYGPLKKWGKLERSFDHVISFVPYLTISTPDILEFIRSKVVPYWA